MKRLIISIIVLTAIIFSSFSFPFYLKNTTINLINKIDDIKSEIKSDNIKSAYIKTKQLSHYWDHKKDIIVTFVNNDDINIISYNISKLPSLLEYHNLSDCSSTLSYIKSIISSIYINDIPSLNNIF